ncbi:phosphate-starvation-inducible PsiE family protein [Rhodopila globiformis]|jgi:uncharacterized membrane protein (DUF373 family)|uniref:Phosphate-starvation-inducible E-like protein n=1 Tax=Rhodopila globiformis TaxID=1071 RepID=A0A2S6MXQ5_RHOGL|nr:phosphate-starvation-inducible PsiE family protein [Rhodopila globiformis]PPQ27145.1 hypothetical protein CCS01_28110 [Rhodopila globiformis]
MTTSNINVDETARVLPGPRRLFRGVEHALYLALGVLLCLTTVMALAGAAVTLWQGLGEWTATETVFAVIDRLLFVLMLIEILHTVQVSVEDGALSGEPFLVVGLIASIRRILVITLESSKVSQQGIGPEEVDRMFRTSMTELGVLAVLILVMVASIYVLRRAQPGGSRAVLLGGRVT